MENMRFRGPASFPLSLWAVIMGTGACMDEFRICLFLLFLHDLQGNAMRLPMARNHLGGGISIFR